MGMWQGMCQGMGMGMSMVHVTACATWQSRVHPAQSHNKNTAWMASRSRPSLARVAQQLWRAGTPLSPSLPPCPSLAPAFLVPFFY